MRLPRRLPSIRRLKSHVWPNFLATPGQLSVFTLVLNGSRADPREVRSYVSIAIFLLAALATIAVEAYLKRLGLCLR